MTNLYAAMPLALNRNPGPTPSVGHVTGDMKRRESNETLIASSIVFRLGTVVILPLISNNHLAGYNLSCLEFVMNIT